MFDESYSARMTLEIIARGSRRTFAALNGKHLYRRRTSPQLRSAERLNLQIEPRAHLAQEVG
jgi:hypothetical protein